MSDLLQSLVKNARREAIQLQHPYIRSEHLLLALITMDAHSLPISYESLYTRIAQMPIPACGAEQKLTLAKGAQAALDRVQDMKTDISSQSIAKSILQSSPMLRRILDEIGEANHATSD